MKLITKSIARALPKLYANDGNLNCKVPLKLFLPWSSTTFYVTEFDGVRTMFGYTVSHLGSEYFELGYIDLVELESARGPFGLRVERDLHWNGNTTLSDVMTGRVR